MHCVLSYSRCRVAYLTRVLESSMDAPCLSSLNQSDRGKLRFKITGGGRRGDLNSNTVTLRLQPNGVGRNVGTVGSSGSCVRMIEAKEMEEQIRILERRELEGGGGTPEGSSLGAEGYASLLALSLLQDYKTENVRWIWKRIPPAMKSSPSVLAELWSLAVMLASRDLPAFYSAAANVPWSPTIAPIVQSLVERVRQEQLLLVGSAYASVGVDALGSLLGLDQQGVINMIATQPGWTYEAETMLITPQEPSQNGNVPYEGGAGDSHLPNLTSYVSFLEN